MADKTDMEERVTAYETLVSGVSELVAKAVKIGFAVIDVDDITSKEMEKFDKLYFVGNQLPNGGNLQRAMCIRAAATAGLFQKESTPSKNDIDNLKPWQLVILFEAVDSSILLSRTPDPNF